MNYKIVKKISPRTGNEIFLVYKRYLWVFWREVGLEIDLEGARKRVQDRKEQDEWVRKSRQKPTIEEYW